MRRQRRFLPTAFSFSALEERIALSHAGGAAVASAAPPLFNSVHGSTVTTLPTTPGGVYAAVFDGTGSSTQFGLIHSVSHLISNPSLGAPNGDIEGVMTVTSSKGPGTMVMVLSGPPSSLQNGHESLHYSIVSASGIFSQELGQHGSAVLHMSATVGPHHKATGQFSLVDWC